MTNETKVTMSYGNKAKVLWKMASSYMTMVRDTTATSTVFAHGAVISLLATITSKGDPAIAVPSFVALTVCSAASASAYMTSNGVGHLLSVLRPEKPSDQVVDIGGINYSFATEYDLHEYRENTFNGTTKFLGCVAGVGMSVSLAASKLGVPALQRITDDMSMGNVVGGSLTAAVMGGMALGSMDKNVKKMKVLRQRICERVVSHCAPR